MKFSSVLDSQNQRLPKGLECRHKISQNCLQRNQLMLKFLNDICEVLRVCPLDFFDYKGEGCKPYHFDHNSGIQHNEGNVTMIDENVLKILLSEKEKRIKDLSDQVDRLWNQVENAHNKD